jgi:hypothetical protein
MNLQSDSKSDDDESQCAQCNRTDRRCLCTASDPLSRKPQGQTTPVSSQGGGTGKGNEWGNLDANRTPSIVPNHINSSRTGDRIGLQNSPAGIVVADVAKAELRWRESTLEKLSIEQSTDQSWHIKFLDSHHRLQCVYCGNSFRRSNAVAKDIDRCPMCGNLLIKLVGNRNADTLYLEYALKDMFEIQDPIDWLRLQKLYTAHRKSDGAQMVVKLIKVDQGYGTGIDHSSIMEQAARHLQIDHGGLARTVTISPSSLGLIVVSEYVKGVGLDSYLAPLQVAKSVRIVTRATVGLQALHSHNLIHGDLSPRDIRITSRGEVKIVGLSPARTRYHSQQTCIHGSCTSVLGWSPTYAAPEGTDSGSLCDIYALGGILFHCATGKQPFSAPNQFQVGIMHQLNSPPRIEDVCPELPQGRDLDKIIGRCMAKNPVERFTDMNALREELEKITWT